LCCDTVPLSCLLQFKEAQESIPGIDSKVSIPPAYVAWRAGASNRVDVPGRRFLGCLKGLQIRSGRPVRQIWLSYKESNLGLDKRPQIRPL
jgi:hypothetical protein